MSLDKINNKDKFAQGEVNVLRIDSEKLIDQVAKKFKAEILVGKRKDTDESIMEGLAKQGEALAKSKAKSDKEQIKSSIATEDQKDNTSKTDLNQNLRQAEDSGKGFLTTHEILVLINLFEIDMYVKAFRHYEAYYNISGEKDVIAYGGDEESDLRD